jgi:hypothetical protein
MALGGSGIGLLPGKTPLTSNPAQLSRVEQVGFTGVFAPEWVWVSTDDQNTSWAEQPLVQLQIALKLRDDAALGLGLSQYHDMSFLEEQEKTVEEIAFVRTIDRSGTLWGLPIGLSLRFGEFSFAGSYEIIYGSLREKWSLDYLESEYEDIDDEVNSIISGSRLTGGFLWSFRDRFSIGAVYRSGSELELDTETWAGDNLVDETDTKLDYPRQFGVGLTVRPVDELLVCGDYVYTPWADAEYEGDSIDDFRDVTEFSFGIEYLRDPESIRYIERIPLRAGFSIRPWYFEKQDETLTESAISFGFGLPFRKDLGSLDIAAQYGWRGDIDKFGAEEDWLRIYVGFSAGGPWID